MRRMFATWRCTVCGLRTSRSAMSPSLRPSATSRSTSRSRGLSSSDLARQLARGRRDAEERRDRAEDVVHVAVPGQVRVALEHDELCVRDERRELLAGAEPDRAVAAAVHDERGDEHLGKRLANVGRERQLEQVRGHLGARGVALERRERRPLLPGSARHERVGQHAAAEPPVLSNELVHRVAGDRSGQLCAVRERAVENEAVDALAVARRVYDGRAAGERAADEAEPAELQVADERVEHAELVFERHRLARPRTIRHAAAEPVVADDLLPRSEALHEAPVRRDLPVLDDIAHPPRGQDERRPGADRGERDAVAVEPEEAGLLGAHGGTVLRQRRGARVSRPQSRTTERKGGFHGAYLAVPGGRRGRSRTCRIRGRGSERSTDPSRRGCSSSGRRSSRPARRSPARRSAASRASPTTQTRGVFYALSDDQSQFNPARFYTLRLDLSDGHLANGDVHVHRRHDAARAGRPAVRAVQPRPGRADADEGAASSS